MDEPRAILVLFLCFIFRSTAEDFLLTSTKVCHLFSLSVFISIAINENYLKNYLKLFQLHLFSISFHNTFSELIKIHFFNVVVFVWVIS